MASLADLREIVAEGRSEDLRQQLAAAQVARRNLPGGAPAPEQLLEVRAEIEDRPGELAAVTTLATEADINVFDIEVVHAAGAAAATLILVVSDRDAPTLRDALEAEGRRPGVQPLGEA
ncbi:MAG: hypothetical protein R2716_04090 [Microthrixaceae bacterium]